MEVYRGGRLLVFDPDWRDGQLGTNVHLMKVSNTFHIFDACT